LNYLPLNFAFLCAFELIFLFEKWPGSRTITKLYIYTPLSLFGVANRNKGRDPAKKLECDSAATV
jgi:hypothetical protein